MLKFNTFPPTEPDHVEFTAMMDDGYLEVLIGSASDHADRAHSVGKTVGSCLFSNMPDSGISDVLRIAGGLCEKTDALLPFDVREPFLHGVVESVIEEQAIRATS
jgi:hypothetical protein